MGFTVVFFNVLTMLLYLSCGFILVKARKSMAAHAKSFSGFLLYICNPAMVINAFQSMEYSPDSFKKLGCFFAVTLLIQLLFFGILYVILHRKYENAKYRLLTIGAFMGNVGFFGLPLVSALFPDHPIAACYSTMYIISMNLLIFTLGIFLITNNRRFISLKSALINPTTVALLIALPLFFLRIRLPEFPGNAIALLGKMTTPVCMLILGMRLSTLPLKSLFTKPFVYTVSLLKLVVFPLFAYACVLFVPGLDQTFKISLLVLSAAPSASMIVSLSELYECERELSANVSVLTTLLSVITLPLLMLALS